MIGALDQGDAGEGLGALIPDVKLGENYLSDRLGNGFTVLCFGEELAAEVSALNPDGLKILGPPWSPALSDRFDATDNSAYLIRPDMHVAGRWRGATAGAVVDGFRRVIFNEGKAQ